jgi:hypothetical protein
MDKQEQGPQKDMAPPPYSRIDVTAAPQPNAALEQVEAALDIGYAEIFTAGSAAAVDTRPPDQLTRMQAGLRAMHACEISCFIEFEKFIIEVNAEQRGAGWFPAFQVFKDGMVVVPWMTPTVPASPTKKIAIELAAQRAITDIRGGLATAFR